MMGKVKYAWQSTVAMTRGMKERPPIMYTSRKERTLPMASYHC